MITHDLGVVAGICDKVLVMYAGRTMEYGTRAMSFINPFILILSVCSTRCLVSMRKVKQC